ncbi:MAG: acyltransferase [Candidatus Curtissbacteria bacterium]|nr:acyltransferase [Candidatus Curtissbacteria bacterium]
MKGLEEIGSIKTIRFLLYSILHVIYHNVIDHLFSIPPARKLYLQLVGARIGNDSVIMDVRFFNWHQNGPKGLLIGNECFVGDETLIDLYDNVVLEDQVTLAQRVTVLTHLNVGYKNHPLQKYFPKTSKQVVFKKGSVIGANCTILPGVTVGSLSFVAAGSVVTKSVPANTLVAGVPAKKVRNIE